MDGGAWWAADHGVARVGHDWATSLSLFSFMHWRRKWQPTPVFLPGESQGREAWRAALYGVAQSRTRLKRRSSSSSSSIQPASQNKKKKNPKRNERTMSICFKSTFMNSAIHSRMIYWKLCVKLFSRCSTLNFKKTTGDSLGSFIILDIKMTF